MAWVNGPQVPFSPYVDWAKDMPWFDQAFDRVRIDPGLPAVSQTAAVDGDADAAATGKELADLLAREFGFDMPVPKGSGNPRALAGLADWIPADLAKRLAPPPDGTVIVGVIDAGIAILHDRFRTRDGKATRVLASWQQSGLWEPDPANTNLPFGNERFEKGINDALSEAGSDEEELYQRLGLIDLVRPLGQRDLAQGHAHGTHVADLAAGFDRTLSKHAVDPDRIRIIAAQLPTKASIGASGTFLEFFAVLAIKRIVDLADAIWALRPAKGEKGGANGYPVVINLSYGQQAGPKDGTTLIEKYVSALIRDRLARGQSPLRIVMPAGNDNLLRCSARHSPKPAKEGPATFAIDWRLQPEDQTSNFVEVWSDLLKGPAVTGTASVPLSIALTPPAGKRIDLGAGYPGSMVSIDTFARVYCRTEAGTLPDTHRIRYVICVAPTLHFRLPDLAAPSGLWRLDLSMPAGYFAQPDGVGDGVGDGAQLYVSVRSDQSVGPGDDTGRSSYFDDKSYQVHEPDGRLRDTYRYPFRDPAADDLDGGPDQPVQRKGTLNALARMTDAVVVGGYRITDGRPADYSSTGLGPADDIGGRWGPTLSFPTDVGAAHTGLLAAGTRSGSVVSMQGTSFATALATRCIAIALTAWFRDPNSATVIGTDLWMRGLAAGAERQMPHPGMIPPWKVGSGRMPMPDAERLPRFWPEG